MHVPAAAVLHVEPISEGAGGLDASNHRRCTPESPLPAPGTSTASRQAPPMLRCLRVSPNGQHLAVGDSRGNLRVYDLRTLTLVAAKEAHDAEIMSMDYSHMAADGACYLATGSRDALIHVFDVTRGYALVATCDTHNAAVTSVRFASLPCGKTALISASADKTLVFRHVTKGGYDGVELFVYQCESLSRGVLYDLAVDPSGGTAVAVGQGFQLRVFDTATGRATKTLQQDVSGGEAVRVHMDPSAQFAICTCADGSVCIYGAFQHVLACCG